MEKQPDRWRVAKDGDTYWYVTDETIEAIAEGDYGHDFDDERWKNGNYFAQFADAEAAAEKIREVFKQAQEAINGRS